MPEDASLLIVAAPVAPLAPEEERAVNAWLADGGRALFIVEPSAESRAATAGLLGAWGLESVPGVVVDAERSVAGDARTLVAQRDQYLGETPITEGGAITAPLGPTLFPGAAAFRPAEEVAARIEAGDPVPVRYAPLVASSADSWAADGPGDAYVEGRDAPGPHTLLLLMQASASPSSAPTAEFEPDAVRARLAVIGDADFASNRYYGDLDNANLFLNVAGWLLEDAALVSVRPRQEVFRPLVLTGPELDFVRYVSWFLAPALLAAAALTAWWRRR